MRFTLLLLAAAFLQSAPPTESIAIQNASFEQQLTNPHAWTTSCGNFAWGSVPGWNFQASTGVFQPAANNPCGIPVPPDGSTVAYVGDSTISQDLGVKASDIQQAAYNAGLSDGQRDGMYVLKFYVTNFYRSYPGYYEAKVSLGSTELCEADGWATENWTPVTLICPAPGYIVFNGHLGFSQSNDLVLSLSSSGWELLFDNVSLTFTPQ